MSDSKRIKSTFPASLIVPVVQDTYESHLSRGEPHIETEKQMLAAIESAWDIDNAQNFPQPKPIIRKNTIRNMIKNFFLKCRMSKDEKEMYLQIYRWDPIHFFEMKKKADELEKKGKISVRYSHVQRNDT